MCGFVGTVGRDAQASSPAIERAAAVLAHRGPDRQGVSSGEAWSLGFRRLSILDLSPSGDQPMATPDGRFHLVFNGEVYNYRELADELRRGGTELRSDGDSEVVLRLLAQEGPAAVERFNGMFALALVDTRERTILLARDRLGVKPLYYRPGTSLSFASELKALLALPGAPREVDPRSLVEYLSLGYLGAESCIFRGYRKLPAGTLYLADLDRPSDGRERRYWDLDVEGDAEPWDPDELEELLEDAVRIRLRSDVPVGVFLSGGIDSGVVTALSKRARDTEASPLALTVGFPGSDGDESSLATATARHVGVEHRIVAQRRTALGDVDRLAWFYDEPFGDQSALGTFALCEAAAEHGRVFLSGDGGDEAFGGYRRYVQAREMARASAVAGRVSIPAEMVSRLLPSTSRARFRIRKATLPDDGFAAFFDLVADDPVVAGILPRPLRRFRDRGGRPVWDRWARTSGRDLTERMRALDYALYLPDDVLVKVDRASMAHSVEVRSPLLDYRLVERAARVPTASLIADGAGKQPLRRLARDLLPPEVVAARKQGFSVPVDDWFREDEGQRFLGERLLGTEATRRGLWDPEGVQRMMRAHQRPGGRQFGELLWRIVMLEAWSRHYLESEADAGSGACDVAVAR